MTGDPLRNAKALIDQRRYTEARQMLENVPGEKAEQWRRKLDERIGVQPVRAMYTEMPPLQREIPMPPPVPRSAAMSPQEVEYRNRLLSVNDMSRAQAQTKSYTGALVLVIILYFIFVIPGIIANVLFYNDGRRMEEIAGMSLPGVDALGALRTFTFVVIVIALILLILVFLIPLLGMQPH